MDQTTNKTTTVVNEDTESPTRKIAAAVLGAIVVIIIILVLILGIQAVRSLISRSQKTPTLATTNNYSLSPITNSVGDEKSVTNTTSAVSGHTTTYKTMPATGPREDALVAMIILGILGSGVVVLSQKFS